MHLRVEENCSECKKCLENCPNFLTQINSMKCLQDACETMDCVNACKQGAIIEIAQGIHSIDTEKCTGCGECIKACPKKAIELINGKAVKCDLCAKNDFFIACEKQCNSIELVKSGKELLEIEKLLGWRILGLKKSDSGKKLVEREEFEIIEKRSGEKEYFLKGFPELTVQEAKLLKETLDEFKAKQSKSEQKNLEIALEKHCEKKLIQLSEEQKNYLLEILSAMVFGFGPISKLLENDEIEEIALIGLGESKPVRIFDRNFGWLKTNICFFDETIVKNLVNKMARTIGRNLTLQTPKLNAVLGDGSRLNAIIEPIAFSGPNFTIRKFRKKPFTPTDLIENKTFSSELMAFLWMALQADCSILIAGNTGSGKTTSLNALFYFIPKNERIIITEETPEIVLPQKHLIKLNVVQNLGIGMQELILDSLRMRPDKTIVGEIRSREEVKAFIDTLLSGQGKGSFATFHAQSTLETIKRLKNFGVMEIDLSAIDLVLVQKRWTKIDLKKSKRKEQRKIIEAAEIIEKEKEIELNPLFEFDFKKNKLVAKNESKKVLQKLCNAFGASEKQIKKEILRRKKALDKMVKGKHSFQECFELIQSFGERK